MMDLLQNSTLSLMGIWVTVSCLSGLLVYLLIKLFDFLYPNQSSSDRYHKSIVGLVFFFLITIASTYVFNDNIKNENTTYWELESVNELTVESSLINGRQESKSVIAPEKSDFMTSSLIFKSLGIFWLIGAFVFSIKMIGGYYYTQNLINQDQGSISQKWNKFIQNQLWQLKIKRDVKVFESQRITSALTFGFIKPVIALPLGFFATLPADQIEAVLLHELYHIKHKDYLINLLTMTFEVIFFYHPLMWWLAKSIRVERENRCDDQVTQIADKQVYAHALLNMESYRQSMNYAIPFSNKQSNLKMRIMRIFEQKPEHNIGLKPFLSLLMIVVFLMGFTFYKLEEPKEESKLVKTAEQKVEEMEKQIPQKPEEKVLFKSEDSRLGLVLEMTKNTLIAKTENEKVKLFVDEKLFPLNQKIPLGEQDIATMYEIEENTAYHFFSINYFKSNNRAKWEKENENRNTYIFDRKTEFFTFRPAKDFASEPDNVSDEEMEEMIFRSYKTFKINREAR
ncbi:M56 family metallopeptidase [Marivirga sp.]|uniref:M56 family metallopeptidase n=1 Tax=Marivirga sp. TaxID=2018662 RepID=UPI0025E86907|nr:M56 family metallopeptidase [Marivirga sp.]